MEHEEMTQATPQETSTATPPKWAAPEALSSMKGKAGELMLKVKESSGPALYRVIDSLGAGSQKQMVAANDSMRGTVSSLLQGMDGKSPTAECLVDLSTSFNELNPHALTNSWWFSWMPKGVKRSAIKKFSGKYASMQSHVDNIMNGLRSGKDELLETNIELESQYKEIEAAHQQIQQDIFIGENLFEMIEIKETETDADDALEVQKLANAKNTVARRIRDLRTKEAAAIQFFVSIDQTMHSNILLGEQIDSALSVGPMVMNNALRIQAALAKQDTVKKAVQEFQQGLGQMMENNATAVNTAAQQIGDLYNNPVVAMESLQKAHDNLMSAVNTANESMATSTIKARESSAQLAEMSAELTPVAQALKENRPSGDAPEALGSDSRGGEPLDTKSLGAQ
jgi:uncharacterized protein YaaN involved in tellurite resistance